MSLHVVSQTLERLVNLGVKKTEVSFIDDGEFFTVRIPQNKRIPLKSPKYSQNFQNY